MSCCLYCNIAQVCSNIIPPYCRLRQKSKSNLAENVAVPDDAFITDFKNFSFENAINNIEGRVDDNDLPDEDDDVIPQAAADMGSGLIV